MIEKSNSNFYQCHACGNPTGCFTRLCQPMLDLNKTLCPSEKLANRKYQANWKELKPAGKNHFYQEIENPSDTKVLFV